MSTVSLNKRFISAFREIDAALDDGGTASNGTSFRDAVYRQVGTGALSARDAQELDELYTMRNLLAHFGVDGQDAFEVQPAAVRRMEGIRNKLTSKAATISGRLGPVETVEPSTPMGQAAALMASCDYSCLPIYAREEFCGLLDADVVMHWVGDALGDPDLPLLEDAPVGDVRGRYPEPAVAFCRPDAQQRDVVARFEQALRDDVPLVAMLITSDGKRQGRLRGIITPSDVPALAR